MCREDSVVAEWEETGEVLLAKGNKAWDTGNRPDAEAAFRQLLNDFPDRPEGYNKMGVVFAETGHLEEAEKYFLTALAQDRKHAPALTNLGNIYLERGQTDEAIQHYLLALQSDPEYPAAHRNLGVAYRRMGKYSAYVSHYKRSQRLAGRRERAETRRRLKGQASGGGLQIPGFVWIIVAAIGAAIIVSVLHR